jgi:thiol:disulfide interchange protein
MERRIRPFLPGWVIVLLFLCTGGTADSLSAGEIVWHDQASGYAAAVEERQASGKPMALYVYVDWCGYCRKFREELLSLPEVEEYLRTLVRVRVNPEKGPEERAIAERHGVSGYPAFFIVPAGGKPPVRILPYRREGTTWTLMAPAEFLRACREAAGQP